MTALGGATSHHRPNPRRLQLSNAELVAPISDVCVPSIILQRDPLIDDATKNSLATPLSVSGVGFPKDGDIFYMSTPYILLFLLKVVQYCLLQICTYVILLP